MCLPCFMARMATCAPNSISLVASTMASIFSASHKSVGLSVTAYSLRATACSTCADDAAAHITRADNTHSNRRTRLFSLLEFSVDNYHNCALATQTISVAKRAAHFLVQPKPTTLKWKVDFHTKPSNFRVNQSWQLLVGQYDGK